MAHITYRDRHTGSFKYETCPECGHEFETEHPVSMWLPYCGSCGKIVLDAAQNYCCWCGETFDDEHCEQTQAK